MYYYQGNLVQPIGRNQVGEIPTHWFWKYAKQNTCVQLTENSKHIVTFLVVFVLFTEACKVTTKLCAGFHI